VTDMEEVEQATSAARGGGSACRVAVTTAPATDGLRREGRAGVWGGGDGSNTAQAHGLCRSMENTMRAALLASIAREEPAVVDGWNMLPLQPAALYACTLR
jgi:hypothetical protein